MEAMITARARDGGDERGRSGRRGDTRPAATGTAARAEGAFDKAALGQVVLVLQGGGALGAYQAGVYQALEEAGIEPDWVIGTSIGAINASLIAGNAVADRMARLRAF